MALAKSPETHTTESVASTDEPPLLSRDELASHTVETLHAALENKAVSDDFSARSLIQEAESFAYQDGEIPTGILEEVTAKLEKHGILAA